MANTQVDRSSRTLFLLIASSGFAALSWEVIWQIKASLALGVSALGTAITLAVMMGGMCIGSLTMGNLLRDTPTQRPIRLFALLEFAIALAGVSLNGAFWLLERLDTWAYAIMPSSISVVTVVGLIAIIGLPALCMGATLPVFKVLSDNHQLSITKLYSLNTFGAATGVLMVALMLIPLFGMTNTIWLIAGVNLCVGVYSWFFVSERHNNLPRQSFTPSLIEPTINTRILFIVFVTGFATFTLEVAWFRSLASLFPNTTDVFAMILASTLIALAMGASKVPTLKQKKRELGTQIALAGVMILLMTPVLEHLDSMLPHAKQVSVNSPEISDLAWMFMSDQFSTNALAAFCYMIQFAIRFLAILLIIVPTLRYLGIAFPWILDEQSSARAVGKLNALNTLAAIIGSIIAAWILLPTIGFAKTAWVAGLLVVVAGMSITNGRKRLMLATLGLIALFIAIYFEAGIGQTQVQGFFASNSKGKLGKVLGVFEGPDATTAALEYDGGARGLLINSSYAAEESGFTNNRPGVHYMAWMGHLPMLLQPDPKKALVICFGTGQTANAVRNENPEELDIVDINKNVFKLAHFFRKNENVLNDARVNAITMDGRAYIRRTQKSYDVITLEPMPPITVGVNALYAKEFYVQARHKLSAHGVIAQWLPFHIAAPHYAASIAKTFIDVFPNAILWLDPASNTGILLASKDDNPTFGTEWPGFKRANIKRNLSESEVLKHVVFNSKQLTDYAAYGETIDDNNQLLAYGRSLYVLGLFPQNLALLRKINSRITATPLV